MRAPPPTLLLCNWLVLVLMLMPNAGRCSGPDSALPLQTSLPGDVDDLSDTTFDFNPEDYSEMASAIGKDQVDLMEDVRLGTDPSGRSLAVGAAIKVLDTQLYVLRGLAGAAFRTGQALIAANSKVSDARTQLASRLLAARLRAVRAVADAGLRAGAALAGGALDAAQAKLRALDSIVRLVLAVSRSLGQAGLAGLDAAEAGRDLLAASLGARLQAIRTVAEASLTLGRTLVQDLLGLPPT